MLDFGCFCFNILRVLSVKVKIRFDKLFVKSLSARLTSPFLIKFLNINKMLIIVHTLSENFCPFLNSFFFIYQTICISFFPRVSSDVKWYIDFDVLLGFGSNKVCITCIVLSAVVFIGESSIQTFQKRIVSSIYFSPATPFVSINRFRIQRTIF